MTDEVLWKDSAREEVRDIYSYLFDVSPKMAENWADELAKKLRYIVQFPEMGRIVPDYQLSEIREVFVGRYRMLYSTQQEVPRILAIRPMGKPLGKI
jgi:toxin ParE1/3/4